MKRISFAVLALLLVAYPSTVLADVAPPANPPGSNLQPGSETTQVRMVAETVQIDVKADNRLGIAHVIADFTMHNLGSQSESMAVRFPISANDGRGQYPELTNLIIKVDGNQVPFQRANYPDVRSRDPQIPWAEFNVTFPAGQDIPIQVTYDLNGSGYMPYTAFYYILETGAGWKDTIGSADIILRLPYPASPQNVVIDMEIGWAKTPTGGVINGNEIRWHFDNFEPGRNQPVQNMEFALVAPVSWQNILKARDNAAQNPNDSEAWGQLAKAYKEIFLMGKGYRDDAGGEELYQLSIAAYEKCLALNPKDAEWHAGFADLLASRTYWDLWMSGPTSADTYRAFNEIRTALQLAPNDPKVLEIADAITGMFPDGMTHIGSVYDFPWLTQTPTPLPPPTQTPILPTPILVILDPAVVSGTYQSNIITLGNGRKLQFTLTLHPDYSAELETKYDNDPVIVSSGRWGDSRNGTFYIDVVAPNKAVTVFNGITLETDALQITGYQPYYEFGNPGIDIKMRRVVTATPVPARTSTLVPTPVVTVPASKPSLPICGSAALIGVVWLAKRKRS